MSVWKFPDYVDTDQILPGTYLSINDSKELANHIFENIKPEMAMQVKQGDIIVAGKYFGCGSSREHAVLAIKGSGVDCVIAESFSRIFFRNAINLGLDIMCVDDVSHFCEGDHLEFDRIVRKIKNITSGYVCQYRSIPEFLERIVQCGGLIPYAQKYLVKGGVLE
ncbi:LeuD/DmdB family oxidoreductase small subunit [Lutispora sp.]|uniref:LeuD/DmdB family oxidoreductase small subunit n=1 Tax=Lutispora sp. TaxID=2828727 RepID=UPI002B2040D4|nr:3-isopropylmalate dehydratase [Lutispora sp.]MEA4962370.1 3-isopropylmalate dehydratase [Lutispora sp.]